MAWNKTKQNLESFLSPALLGRVEYRATGYRYAPDKSGRCYIAVDKREIFNTRDAATGIRWYQTDQEIKNNPNIQIPVDPAELEKIRKENGGNVPEERLAVMARSRKLSQCAKEIMAAQTALYKSDFYAAVNRFLTDSIERNLESDDILLNVLALVDRRVGKKRLLAIEKEMQMKHPVVQYFYHLRRSTM